MGYLWLVLFGVVIGFVLSQWINHVRKLLRKFHVGEVARLNKLYFNKAMVNNAVEIVSVHADYYTVKHFNKKILINVYEHELRKLDDSEQRTFEIIKVNSKKR